MAKKEERFCIHDVSEYVECPECDAEDAANQSYLQTTIKELKKENERLRALLREMRAASRPCDPSDLAVFDAVDAELREEEE